MKHHFQVPVHLLLLAFAWVSCSMSLMAAGRMPTTIRFPEVLFCANSAEPISDSSFYFLDDHRINTMNEVIADMAAIMRENRPVMPTVLNRTKER
jgi:hypothetical protein